MTTNITTTTLTTGQSSKEATISQMIGELDTALSSALSCDCTSGNVSVTATQLKSNQFFEAINVSTSRSVTFATPSKRLIMIAAAAGNTHSVDFKVGTTTITLAAGANEILYLDGTANGAFAVAGGSAGSSTLAGDTDVNISSPANGDVLTYDTGSSKWLNQAPATSAGMKQYVYGDTATTTYGSTGQAAATVGIPLYLLEGITIDKIWIPLATGVNTHVYKAAIYVVNSSGVISSIVGSATNTWTTGQSLNLLFDFTGTPLVLSAATPYMIAITDTSAAGGTTTISLQYVQASGRVPQFRSLPIDVTSALSLLTDYNLASINPVATNTFTAHISEQTYPWTLRRSA